MPYLILHRIYGMFNFKRISYVVIDPELVKRITVRDFDHFVDHSEMFVGLDILFGKSVLSLSGQKWKDMRSTLSPMFTSSKMKMMFGLLSNHAEDFVTHFAKKAGSDGKNDIDVLDIFSRFTADGISTAALGFEGDCVKNDDSEIYKIVKKMMNDFTGTPGMLKILFGFAMPAVYKFFGLQLSSKETYNFFKSVTIDAMNERDRKNLTRTDVIQLMLEVKKGQLNAKESEEVVDNFTTHEELNLKTNVKNLQQFIDDDEMWIAQGFIFFFGGFDTTSNLLQSTTFHLAKNPEVQEELYREISEVRDALNGKPVTYEALHKMKFMDMVVSEGLRIQPPLPQSDRNCTKTYELDLGNGKSVLIEKDSTIFIPIYSLHHDPEYFPNPEKFDPFRFSDDNKDSIVAGSYLPFGLGPRACIGSRFALMEAKLLLFNVLANFEILKSARTPEKLTFTPNMSMRIKETVYLNFKRR